MKCAWFTRQKIEAAQPWQRVWSVQKPENTVPLGIASVPVRLELGLPETTWQVKSELRRALGSL